MAASSAYKLGIVISADATSVRPAVAEAKTEIASIGTAAAATETKMQQLVATFSGLHTGAANGNQRAWTGALAAEGLAIDSLRAKYNPLFAVIQRYRDAKAEIRTANAMGALSINESTAALDRERKAALASIDAIKGRSSAMRNGHNFAATNAMFQFQDIGMTAAMGMNPGMIALQQGSQLAGGFAGMSLKDVGSAVAGGFTQLLSPVSLATVAITGLTAAAIQYAMKWTGNAKSLSQTIEEHEAQIKSLRDAYQYAGTAAEAYFQRINAGQFFQSNGNRKQLEKTVKTGSNQMLGQLGMQSTGNLFIDAYGTIPDDAPWMVHSPYTEFEAAILHLQKTAKDGKPDILGFRQMVEERWSLDRNNEGLSKTAKELLEMGTEATTAALRLEQLKEARARFMAQEAQRRADEYSSSISSLRGIVAPQLSDRRQVEDTYATAYGNAGDRDERADALKQRDEALVRINAQEARQIQLAQIDIQLQIARDPLTRADLTAQRERIELSGMEIDAIDAENRIRQARNRVIAESLAQSSVQILDMQSEIEARKKVNDAIAAGAMTSADAQVYLQAEAQLRPLIAAAAKAEGEEKQKLLAIIKQTEAGYKALAEEQRRASALEYIQSQKDTIANLQGELAVVGETETVRSRVMAQLEAEQKIRQLGIGTQSAMAEQIRAEARLREELTLKLEKQSDAWSKVRQTGEDAIDSLVDNLKTGDFSGALEDISSDLTKTFLTLGVSNPLKNSLLGTNYGTMADVGGLSGIVSKLFGGEKVDAGGIIKSALGTQPVGTMSVTAATVMINGAGGVGANVSKLLSGANDNAGTSVASLTGGGNALSFVGNYKSGVDSRLTDILQTAAQNFPGFKVDAISGFRPGDPRFHGKGLATDVQLTDLLSGKVLGNYQDASSFGQYEQFAQVARQVQMQKYPELADQFRWGGYFGGGKGKYGALDTMHFDLAGGQIGMGGGSWANGLTPQQMALWPGVTSKGMDTATAALERLAETTTSTTQNLGQFGGGLETIAQSLLGGGTGSTSTGGGLGGLFSGILSLFGFSDGGYTGPGGIYEPRGVVHAGEVVWSQRDVARAGGPAVVDAMRLGRRGYASGGVVAVTPLPQSVIAPTASNGGGGSNVSINVINNTGQQVEQQETTDSRGNRQVTMIVGDQVSATVKKRGSPARKAFQQEFNVQPRGIGR